MAADPLHRRGQPLVLGASYYQPAPEGCLDVYQIMDYLDSLSSLPDGVAYQRAEPCLKALAHHFLWQGSPHGGVRDCFVDALSSLAWRALDVVSPSELQGERRAFALDALRYLRLLYDVNGGDGDDNDIPASSSDGNDDNGRDSWCGDDGGGGSEDSGSGRCLGSFSSSVSAGSNGIGGPRGWLAGRPLRALLRAVHAGCGVAAEVEDDLRYFVERLGCCCTDNDGTYDMNNDNDCCGNSCVSDHRALACGCRGGGGGASGGDPDVRLAFSRGFGDLCTALGEADKLLQPLLLTAVRAVVRRGGGEATALRGGERLAQVVGAVQRLADRDARGNADTIASLKHFVAAQLS